MLMMWFRFIMMGMLSITALSILSYQWIEFFLAFTEYFNKSQ